MIAYAKSFYLLGLAACLVACGSGGSASPSPPLPPSPTPPTPPSNDSGAAGIVLSNVVLDQPFQTAQPDYTATVGVLLTSTSVTVDPSDTSASITVNGQIFVAGISSFGIGLDEGGNIITVVISAEDGVTTSTYIFDVTRQTAASFDHEAYVKASNTESEDFFGASIVLSGNTLAVGVPQEDSSATSAGGDQSDNNAEQSGAVYVFSRDLTGVWSQQAYIKASNAETGDRFGASIALDGDTLVVGAPNEDSAAVGVGGDQSDNNAQESGAVYVFSRDTGGVWTEQAYIKASNTEAADWFGTSVALSAKFLAVGAPGEDSMATGADGDQADNSVGQSGSVYVYTRDPVGGWPQDVYLKAPLADADDLFGTSVGWGFYADAVFGDFDMLAVGAPGEDSDIRGPVPPGEGNLADNSATDSGAVYVISHNEFGVPGHGPEPRWGLGTAFVLKASNAEALDAFGETLAFEGTTLAVSATGEDSNTTGVDGDQADNSAADSGAVYVFRLSTAGGDWVQRSYLKASNTEAGDAFSSGITWSRFGLAVTASGEDSSAIGVNGDEADNTMADSGAAYLFTGLRQYAYVKASNTEAGDRLTTIAWQGDTVVVGATHEDSNAIGIGGDQADNTANQSGAVYVVR